ncbi:MAG TPA: DUF6524 family protein [Gemmatimonadales bacterium]|nr:DUF6524 family protein [Gemmatimonadales bacterium]
MAQEALSWGGLGLRFGGALLLVHATFNPEGYSYYHWALAPVFSATGGLSTFTAVKFLAGVILAGGWLIYLQATRRSLGVAGSLLVLALAGGIIWLLIDWHVVNPTSFKGIAHVVLFAVALLLTLGVSWSHVRRRITGQVDTDVVG